MPKQHGGSGDGERWTDCSDVFCVCLQAGLETVVGESLGVVVLVRKARWIPQGQTQTHSIYRAQYPDNSCAPQGSVQFSGWRLWQWTYNSPRCRPCLETYAQTEWLTLVSCFGILRVMKMVKSLASGTVEGKKQCDFFSFLPILLGYFPLSRRVRSSEVGVWRCFE